MLLHSAYRPCEADQGRGEATGCQILRPQTPFLCWQQQIKATPLNVKYPGTGYKDRTKLSLRCARYYSQIQNLYTIIFALVSDIIKLLLSRMNTLVFRSIQLCLCCPPDFVLLLSTPRCTWLLDNKQTSKKNIVNYSVKRKGMLGHILVWMVKVNRFIQAKTQWNHIHIQDISACFVSLYFKHLTNSSTSR